MAKKGAFRMRDKARPSQIKGMSHEIRGLLGNDPIREKIKKKPKGKITQPYSPLKAD